MSHISNEPLSVHKGRYQVLALLCVCALIAYVQRAALSVPAAEIAGDLRFSDLTRDMGWIQSGWYLGYALMQLPSGWLADRIGSRRGLAILCVAWSLASLLCALATGSLSLLLLWSVMGAAQAGAFPCAVKALGQIFPETERARATGLLGCGMTIGGALAPVMAAVVLQSLSPWASSLHIGRWRLLLAAYALPGIVWTAAFLALISARKLPARERTSAVRSPVNWSRMLSSGPLALLCAQQFFRAAGMVFFLTWFPTFLQKTRDVSLLNSGILTTLAGVGGVVGSLTGGFFSDWLLQRTGNARLSRQGIAVAGMASCSLLITSSYFLHSVNGSIALISLGTCCATFGGVSGYTVAISFGGSHVATVFSAMNMFGNVGAALFPVTAGWLVARTGNWNLMLFLFAGIMAIDAVCWALLNPRGTLFGDEHADDHGR
ncbi:MAG TPA: MFS transporter [Planctomycetaceae bacterium]|jgi:MFS family permease|nr:MFS transporter [Planctomycetaceae bacterium]